MHSYNVCVAQKEKQEEKKRTKRKAKKVPKHSSPVETLILSCINKMYLKDCFYCGYYFILIILFNVFSVWSHKRDEKVNGPCVVL